MKILNEYDAVREMESLRLASEHAKWLRDERQKSYAGLSLAGKDVLQFIRSEMPMLIGPSGVGRREATAARWIELRTELRKAYNRSYSPSVSGVM
jgi:hypothetical protein